MPRSGIAGSYDNSILNFLKKTPHCLQFTFPPAVQEHSVFTTSSSEFIISRHFYDGHSDQCEVIPHCGFDSRFPDD